MPPKTPEPRKVQIHNQHPGLDFSRPELRALFRTLDLTGVFDAPNGEISIAFLPNPAMGKLHEQYHQDPSPTDVITFPGDPAFGFAGEICVCPDSAADIARRRRIPFTRELTLYLVHGYLHLCGYDDTTPPARQKMRRAEQKALQLLESKARIPSFSLRGPELPQY